MHLYRPLVATTLSCNWKCVTRSQCVFPVRRWEWFGVEFRLIQNRATWLLTHSYLIERRRENLLGKSGLISGKLLSLFANRSNKVVLLESQNGKYSFFVLLTEKSAYTVCLLHPLSVFFVTTFCWARSCLCGYNAKRVAADPLSEIDLRLTYWHKSAYVWLPASVGSC